MAKVKDGWHKFYGYKVWLEDGKVIRAYDPEAGYGMKTLYPYREGKYGGYDLDQDMSIETFRSAWNRGTAYLLLNGTTTKTQSACYHG